MTLLIEKAEKELNTRQNALNQRWYPRFHLAARAGWMNDPNGLTWFDGWYHAFISITHTRPPGADALGPCA